MVEFTESHYEGKLSVVVKMDTCLRRYDGEGKSLLLCRYDRHGKSILQWRYDAWTVASSEHDHRRLIQRTGTGLVTPEDVNNVVPAKAGTHFDLLAVLCIAIGLAPAPRAGDRQRLPSRIL